MKRKPEHEIVTRVRQALTDAERFKPYWYASNRVHRLIERARADGLDVVDVDDLERALTGPKPQDQSRE
jgi:hypothetical protein